MTPGQWDRVRELFHDALDLPPAERATFIKAKCDDREVLVEVESLLADADNASELLNSPAIERARDAIETAISDPATQQPRPTDQLIGDVINQRYEIVKLLGRGGHAAVLLALDRKVGNRKVVVKILDPDADTAHQSWLHKKFQQEINILGKISHPGVVGISDCGQLAGGEPFLVLDFVAGVNLRERLRDPVETVEIAEIIR